VKVFGNFLPIAVQLALEVGEIREIASESAEIFLFTFPASRFLLELPLRVLRETKTFSRFLRIPGFDSHNDPIRSSDIFQTFGTTTLKA